MDYIKYNVIRQIQSNSLRGKINKEIYLLFLILIIFLNLFFFHQFQRTIDMEKRRTDINCIDPNCSTLQTMVDSQIEKPLQNSKPQSLVKQSSAKCHWILIIIQFSFLCLIFAFVVILYVQLNETTNTLSQLQRSFEKYVQTNISNSTNGSSSALTQTDLNNAISGLLISITSQIGTVNSSINLMLNEPQMQISGVNYPKTLVNPAQLKQLWLCINRLVHGGGVDHCNTINGPLIN